MELPNPIVHYIRGILRSQGKVTCTWLAKLLGTTSHDKLTRALSLQYQLQHWILSHLLIHLRTVPVTVIIDETTQDKPFAKALSGGSWIYSTKKESTVYGYAWVVLTVSVGDLTVPVLWKRWDPDDEKTRIDLAMELLVDFRALRIPVKMVLFDSYYAAGKLLLLLDSLGLSWITQLKSNRKLNGIPISKIRSTQPYWTIHGHLEKSIKVTVAKHRKRYYCSNCWMCTHRSLVTTYQKRWDIEEVFRFAHSQLGLSGCQARLKSAQVNHFTVCMYACIALSLESHRRGNTLYEIKEDIVLNRYSASTPLLQCFLASA